MTILHKPGIIIEIGVNFVQATCDTNFWKDLMEWIT